MTMYNNTQCQAEQTAFVMPQQERRSANYKPNIWKYDFIETLHSEYDGMDFKRQAEELKNEVIKHVLNVVVQSSQLAKLEFVDRITKLGLAYLFDNEIRLLLNFVKVVASSKISGAEKEEDLYATALRFRLLRQYGYQVSDDLFCGHMDEKGAFNIETCGDMKGILELFEASELNSESESVLDKAKSFSTEALKEIRKHSFINKEHVEHVLALSSQKRVNWFDVKWHINLYEEDNKNGNPILLRLAKLNFNVVQATHQNDLKDISRWWRKLGLIENMDFTRDRLVECFMLSVGLASEPHFNSFRKWIAKVILFLPLLDDVYDVYGSFQELQCFTNAVERWEVKGIEQLTECMQLCFYGLYNTTNAIAHEMQTQNGWDRVSVLPYLIKVWGDFCRSLLVEAKWYNERHIPSLQEYLSNAWITSTVPTALIHAFFAMANNDHVTDTMELEKILDKIHPLIYNSSLILRLCNDLATSQAEQERGDAPSSILCYMIENNVSEEIAREHIENMIANAWKQMNGVECSNLSMKKFADVAKNVARVAHNLYQDGDGFGVQDGEMRNQIRFLFVEPLILG